MKIPLIPIILVVVMVFCACAHQPPPASRRSSPSWRNRPALADSVGLAELGRLPAAERRARRRLAEAAVDRIDMSELNAGHGIPMTPKREREAYRRFSARQAPRDEDAVPRILFELRRAVSAAPDFTRAWLAMGEIATALGDWNLAAEALAAARSAWLLDPAAREDPQLERRVRLAGAWLCRDRGLWEEGLAWLDGEATPWPRDLLRERQLVRGLLLAGAGRFQDAYLISRRMEPYRISNSFPSVSGRSFTRRNSAYANRWIQAMAWFHQGELELARHALGVVRPQALPIPHMARYWRDMGLLDELDGDVRRAGDEYALGMMGLAPLIYQVPFEGFSFPAVIHEQPDTRIPCVTWDADKFMAGSMFSYACQMMADCSVAQDSTLRASRGARAIEAFSTCMRRLDRPLLAQALRGRSRYYMGEDEAALPDLLEAHRALAAGGRIDAVTSTVIGIIHANADRHAEAIPFLEEATNADPGLAAAWRILGVVYAGVNRHVEADVAMDRAVELDPYVGSGWYNRGLHNMNLKRMARANHDLLVASHISPDDPAIGLLLARLERDMEPVTDPATQADAQARADSVWVELESGAGRALQADGDRHGLEAPGGRRPLDPTGADLEAHLDALAAAHRKAPTPATRLEFATACVAAGRTEWALELLVPHWPGGLSLEEKLLVLQSDRDLGHSARAREIAASLAVASPTVSDLRFWTLVAIICLDGGDRENGLRALDHAVGLAPANHALTSFRKLLTSGGGR